MSADPGNWMTYIPPPIKWLIGSVVGFTFAFQALPEPWQRALARFVTTDRGETVLTLVACLSCCALVYYLVERRAREADARHEARNAACEERHSTCDRRTTRLSVAFMTYLADGDRDAAIKAVRSALEGEP